MNKSSRHAPRIAIVGAGFGGICMAVKLKRAGFTSFTVYERSPRVGGTWWDNTYPGAACDVESHLYSFSFFLYDWKRSHASQPEIQAYLETVVDAFGIREHFRLGTAIVRAEWNVDSSSYDLTTTAGERLEADVVVSGLGMLNHPRYPDWPGLETFSGPKFHTARWEHHHELRGKRVAVVGTGSTAAQIVPALAPDVGQLLVFQRQPGWVVPKPQEQFSPRQRLWFRVPGAKRLKRFRIFLTTERNVGSVKTGSPAHQKAEAALRQYLDQTIESPVRRAALRPDYPFRCKRPVRSSDFYPALNRTNVELVASPVVEVTEHGVIDAVGQSHDVDVLVMATGFQPTNFLATLEVVGPGGRTLQERWGGEPEALLGITYAGMPNFFMLYGPNTNPSQTSVAFQIERQTSFVMRTLRHMARTGSHVVDTRPSAMRRYNQWLQKSMRGTVYDATCHNYYRSPSGKVVTNWPHTSSLYWALTRVPLHLVLEFRKAPVVSVSSSASSAPAGEGAVYGTHPTATNPGGAHAGGDPAVMEFTTPGKDPR